jgi:phosphopantothenoylcysteine decarboxylase/phosphopantothenate--cysteine ligase
MTSVFAGKNIVLGVSGSIAAFKVAGWVSTLAKEEANVSVIMTESARQFVTPLTFEALSGNKTYCNMFGSSDNDAMVHINLGREADLLIVAPATANTIAKLANGLADDLLTTTSLVTRAEVFVCPAMNGKMYSHAATVENLKKLKEIGYHVLDPAHGMMACKEEGDGRLAEWEDVAEHFAKALTAQELIGKKVLVTAGPTREPLDPARFLSNRSSGKMGYAMARSAFRRGAEVTLVSGPTTLACPAGVKRIEVQSARDMYDAVLKCSDKTDIIVKTSAVADYRPATKAEHKVKKDQIESELRLKQNPDILYELGKRKRKGQLLVGFAAESQDLQTAGIRKLEKKRLDLIAVNDISGTNSGFESENNQVLLIFAEGSESLPHTSKQHTADLIWDKIVSLGQQ